MFKKPCLFMALKYLLKLIATRKKKNSNVSFCGCWYLWNYLKTFFNMKFAFKFFTICSTFTLWKLSRNTHLSVVTPQARHGHPALSLIHYTVYMIKTLSNINVTVICFCRYTCNFEYISCLFLEVSYRKFYGCCALFWLTANVTEKQMNTYQNLGVSRTA